MTHERHRGDGASNSSFGHRSRLPSGYFCDKVARGDNSPRFRNYGSRLIAQFPTVWKFVSARDERSSLKGGSYCRRARGVRLRNLTSHSVYHGKREGQDGGRRGRRETARRNRTGKYETSFFDDPPRFIFAAVN